MALFAAPPAPAAPLVVAAAPAAPAVPASLDQDYLGRINGLRVSLGLRPLVVDHQLTDLARQHSAEMAGAGQLYHTSNQAAGVTSNWTRLGENVGTGGSSASVWTAFLKSPPHYAALVNPAFTHVGIGVVAKNRIHWVTHRFMASAAVGAPVPTPVSPAPSPVPVPAPVPVPEVPEQAAAPVAAAVVAEVPTTVPGPADPNRVALLLLALHHDL